MEPDDHLARFILSRREFSPTHRRVKAVAFLPESRGSTTSVFRIAGLAEPEIWKIGEKVADLREKTLHARADVTVWKVQEVGLSLDPDDTPPRHANIRGWPSDKAEQLSIAQQLAASAVLQLPHGEPGGSPAG
ncbi:MAG TPA: hypothetical protein VFJ16_13675 [Longimicrobium sp.]|nr:hypothetical protein [Longimicrobium sp.]